MKKLISFIVGGAGLLLAAGAVLAYSGNHSFTNVSSVSTDGHSAVSSYQARGSFPFDGQGNYDRSKISLLGTLTVTEKDGLPVVPTQNYCLKIQGKVNNLGVGNVTVTEYKDLRCKSVANQNTGQVLGYSETAGGAFALQFKDSLGVVTTASGSHAYSR